jgi:hypothetical protein
MSIIQRFRYKGFYFTLENFISHLIMQPCHGLDFDQH